MENKIKLWEEKDFTYLNNNLIIVFEILDQNLSNEDNFFICAKMFWNNNPNHSYVIEEINFYTPSNINHTFENGISVKGNLIIREFSDFDNKNAFGIFGNFYYYEPNTTNYISHSEGFITRLPALSNTDS